VTGVRPGHGRLDHADGGRQALELLGALLRFTCPANSSDMFHSSWRIPLKSSTWIASIWITRMAFLAASGAQCH